MRGPTAPLTSECLGIRTILALLDHPEEVSQEDVEHLSKCRYCQRAVALARRDLEIIDAPWSEELGDAVGAAPAGAGVSGVEKPEPDRPPTAGRRWRFGGLPAWAGMAAVLVVAVGVGWWLTQEGELLGPLTGEFKWAAVTRAGEQPDRQYHVTVELESPAHLTWLYLDHTRKLQPPRDAAQRTEEFPAGAHAFHVTVTGDPPGHQWIAAVASDGPFNPFELRDDLQQEIGNLPEGAPFGALIEQLEEALRERPGLSFSSHRFEVPGSEGR